MTIDHRRSRFTYLRKCMHTSCALCNVHIWCDSRRNKDTTESENRAVVAVAELGAVHHVEKARAPTHADQRALDLSECLFRTPDSTGSSQSPSTVATSEGIFRRTPAIVAACTWPTTERLKVNATSCPCGLTANETSMNLLAGSRTPEV